MLFVVAYLNLFVVGVVLMLVVDLGGYVCGWLLLVGLVGCCVVCLWLWCALWVKFGLGFVTLVLLL